MCDHNDIGDHDCTHDEDVALNCFNSESCTVSVVRVLRSLLVPKARVHKFNIAIILVGNTLSIERSNQGPRMHKFGS